MDQRKCAPVKKEHWKDSNVRFQTCFENKIPDFFSSGVFFETAARKKTKTKKILKAFNIEPQYFATTSTMIL